MDAATSVPSGLDAAVAGLVATDPDGNPTALTPEGLVAARAMLARETVQTRRDLSDALAALIVLADQAVPHLRCYADSLPPNPVAVDVRVLAINLRQAAYGARDAMERLTG